MPLVHLTSGWLPIGQSCDGRVALLNHRQFFSQQTEVKYHCNNKECTCLVHQHAHGLAAHKDRFDKSKTGPLFMENCSLFLKTYYLIAQKESWILVKWIGCFSSLRSEVRNKFPETTGGRLQFLNTKLVSLPNILIPFVVLSRTRN